jgi:redox-sensitive bicupin YhaK (pirin superfamily)
VTGGIPDGQQNGHVPAPRLLEGVRPEAPYLHLFVTRGSVDLEGAGTLAAGDAVRFTATGGQRVSASEPAEILVWEMHADLAG